MPKVIVIISYDEDLHASHLSNVAMGMGVQPILWDISKYPKVGGTSLSVSNSKVTEFTLSLDGKTYTPDQISGVWWRRPGGAKKAAPETPMGRYTSVESEFVVRSLRDHLSLSNWISDPEATRLAGRKPVQLCVAKEIGLHIPDTCITNSPATLLNFLERLGPKQVIMKPVGSAFMHLDPTGRTDTPENRIVLTQIVDKKLLRDNAEMVSNCPVIFQEAIQKDYDIRVTVVDSTVYAAGIKLEGCDDSNNLDWRNHKGTRVYFTHKLPTEIADMCISVTKQLGLRFGCIDLGFSEKDGYTFFEINPQGQWLPSELKLGYTVSESLVSSLTQ